MKLFKRVGFIMSFLVAVGTVSIANDLEDGLQSFNAGDLETAYVLLTIEAEKGGPEIQALLGSMYRAGEGVPQDDEKAARWYRLAAEQGHAVSQYLLGDMHIEGKGVSKSYESAYAWWVVAAANGNKLARENMEYAQERWGDSEINDGLIIAKSIWQQLHF